MLGQIDVFISYKREERGIADALTNTLTASGFVVVTDFNISKNEEFGDAIDTMIRKARMTIVLWTKAASKSPWVRQEARLARDLSRAAGHPNHYLGVMVESVDLLLPSDLRGLQMIDAQLSGLTDAKLDEVTAYALDVLGRPTATVGHNAVTKSIAISDEFQLFEYARTIDVIPAYQKYIDVHPNGEFVDIAMGLVSKLSSEAESIAFARASGIDTLSAYLQFLSDYPSGTHHADAEHRVKQLKRWYFFPFRRGIREYFVAAAGLLAAVFFGFMGLTGNAGQSIDVETLQARLKQSEENNNKLEGRVSSLVTEIAAAEAEASKRIKRISELELSLSEAMAALPIGVEVCMPRFGKQTVMIIGTCVPSDSSSLTLAGKDFSNLSDLRKLPELKRLFINRGGDVDLETISNLPLTHLSIQNTNLTDIGALAGVDTLESLNVSSSDITNLSPLLELPNLKFLWTAAGTQFLGRDDVTAAIKRSMRQQ